MFFYTVFSILAGTSTHFGAFMTFRLLQGLFVGVGLALGGGSCSDLYDSHARGRAMAIYVLWYVLDQFIHDLLSVFFLLRHNTLVLSQAR